jgi:hypothetical protein
VVIDTSYVQECAGPDVAELSGECFFTRVNGVEEIDYGIGMIHVYKLYAKWRKHGGKDCQI